MASSNISCEQYVYGDSVAVTSSSKTAPQDGVIRVSHTPNVVSRISITIDSVIAYQYQVNNAIYVVTEIPIRRGQTYFGTFSNGEATYIPYNTR